MPAKIMIFYQLLVPFRMGEGRLGRSQPVAGRFATQVLNINPYHVEVPLLCSATYYPLVFRRTHPDRTPSSASREHRPNGP